MANQNAPRGPITTDFQTAIAGDVLDRGEAVRYRYLLLRRAPVLRSDGQWSIAGRPWIFTKQAFSKTVMSFRFDDTCDKIRSDHR